MKGITKDLWSVPILLFLGSTTVAQTDPGPAAQGAAIESKIQTCRGRLQQAEAELAAEKNRLPELARAKKVEFARRKQELDAAVAQACAALEQAQAHIHEHTTSCDVVQAQRTGQAVTADALRKHNQALAGARAEVQRKNLELTKLKNDLSILGVQESGQSPEEREAQQAIIRLQGQVTSIRGELAGLEGNLRQLRMLSSLTPPKPRRDDARSPEDPRRQEGVGRSESPYGGAPNPDENVSVYPVPTVAPRPLQASPEGEGGDRAADVPGLNGPAASGGMGAPQTEDAQAGEALRVARAEQESVAMQNALSATIDRLLADPSSSSSPPITDQGWNFAGKVSEQAKQATERLAAVSGDPTRSTATRWSAAVAGTFTQTFTGETTRKEYGAAAEKVGSYIETVGSSAGLAPGGQAASAELSALGAGFSLAGKLMQADKPLDEAMKISSAAGLVEVVRHRVKNGYLGAALDGVSVASQLLPGEDQDYVGAAIKVFEGVATIKVDVQFSKELDALKAERAGGRWVRGGVYSDMQEKKKQQRLIETVIGAPGNVKTIAEKNQSLLDHVTGGDRQVPHK